VAWKGGVIMADNAKTPVPLDVLDQVCARFAAGPSPAQLTAVRGFALRHGRTWKATLREAWFSGRYPDEDRDDNGLLQQLRNQFGPAWLNGYRLTEGQ